MTDVIAYGDSLRIVASGRLRDSQRWKPKCSVCIGKALRRKYVRLMRRVLRRFCLGVQATGFAVICARCFGTYPILDLTDDCDEHLPLLGVLDE